MGLGGRRVFQLALNAQTHIELALAACALERYYLAHQQYPETLQELVPDYLDASPRDPMTHEPWHYRRDEERGFRLYTVGKNGRDDGGESQDDILWSVEAVAPKLPEFEYMSPSELNELEERMEREMREKFGQDYQEFLMKSVHLERIRTVELRGQSGLCLERRQCPRLLAERRQSGVP